MAEGADIKATHEVFISYCNDDEDWYSCIKKLLEGQNVDTNMEIHCEGMNDFRAGVPLLRSISKAIEECSITMVVVTKNSLDRQFLRFEFMKALEKSQRDQELSVVLVLIDVHESEVQDRWHDQIHEKMVVKVTSNEDWQSEFLTSMIERIKDKQQMEPIQVEVNLSVGQVWSHFFGYSKNVMPVLIDRIQASRWYHGNETRFPLKEFNLIPRSATAVESLSEIHERIVSEGALDVITAQRGSYKNRPYTPPVYSITDDNEQKYYFVAHIPNTLSILSEKQLKQQSDTGKQLKISPGERSLQVAQFIIMFNHLLNHPLNKECNDKVELIEYDDEKMSGEQIVQLILEAVKRACSNTEESDGAKMNLNVQKQSEEEDMEYSNEDYANTVYIAHIDDDAGTAEELKHFLNNQGIYVWEKNSPEKTVLTNFTEATKNAKWFVFILSKKSMTELQKQNFRIVLQKSIFENEVRLIPLLNEDVDEKDLPGDLRSVLCLNKSSTNYKELIAATVKSRSIKMEAKVTVKGVHSGMAWAYAINYLEVTKVNISEKETRKLAEMYTNAKIHHKLFLLIPKSCQTKQLGELDKDVDGCLLDPSRFKILPEEFKIENTRKINGIDRFYQLLPYMVTDDNRQEHIVFAEYVNPVKCLQEMLDNDMRALSGLTTNVFDDEVNKFQALLKDIIHWQKLDEQFAVVFYDDKGTDVVNVLLDLLDES